MDMLPGDSDWERFSDSGSSEDIEELDFLYGRRASSIFSSLEESIGKIDDLLSFERGFIQGDIVCSVTDPCGQMGRVISVKMFVDLENVHGKIIKDVDSKKLLRIRSISAGDYVVHGAWIGRVDKVVDIVTIDFDNGTTSEVTVFDQEKLLPISSNFLEDSTYPYYPGQRVQVRYSTVSKSAQWLCGAWKKNQNVGTLSAVEAGLVYVDWLACATIADELSLSAPPHLQDAKNLTLFSCFSHEIWQLGDWCVLSMDDSKPVKGHTLFDASTIELVEEQKKKAFKRQDYHSSFQDIFVIVKTKTIVDVVWQDGGCSLGLDSQSLLPINIVNAHEFWPGQFVLEKGTCDDPHVSSNNKWGVVKGVDAKERTVKVKWMSIGVNQANDLHSDHMEEIVSAYELVEHPDYSYCYGDIVFRNTGQTDKHHLHRETGMGDSAALVGNDSGRDQIDPSKAYLSCVGHVTGFKDGAVEVKWASGIKTKVTPNDIFRIDKLEGSTATSLASEHNVEEVNQEMVAHDKQFSVLKGKELLNSTGVGEELKKYPWDSSSSSLPQCTLGFLTSIAARIIGYFGSTSMSGPTTASHISEDGNQSKSPEEEGLLENFDLCTEMQTLANTSLEQEVNNIQENKELQSPSSSKGPEQFKQFDMMGDCSDHHFLDVVGKGMALPQVKRSWLKMVQLEWSILEKDLPESIYVHIYEERMDLLRAAIIGAPGTPYHDGLFFFDIYLPPEYPHEPPMVHYHASGLRIKPNLYESGKACLSLLNTWTGTGSELWNPESSSILQVLLSLQALVLNEKPYFNEAGYDIQMGRAEGEKNSVSYNENAFLMTWKSMLYLLRHPPKHFEALMEEHLRRRSQHILSACNAYMEGTPVAFALGETTQQENQPSSSTGFKIMLAKLFPKLVEAFSDKGIDCSQPPQRNLA